MIRILIADDHPIVRQGLRAVFETAPELEIVAEAASAEEAVAAASMASRDGAPVHVATMDLRFGEASGGVEATRRLRRLDPAPAVLVVTNYDDDEDILGAIEAGAAGYLLKDAPPSALIEAVKAAAGGRNVLAPHVMDRLIERMRRPEVSLTPREREVLELLAEGLSNQEIGARLVLSQPTVKSHLARLYGKLGVPSRTAALARARELGLLR